MELPPHYHQIKADEARHFANPDVKPMGAVTISRNGYIQELEAERDALSAKLDRILELTTHDDIYWAIERRCNGATPI